jgi:hypothetical protein
MIYTGQIRFDEAGFERMAPSELIFSKKFKFSTFKPLRQWIQ